MVHVLFVCLGNICRSPMAEAVFRHLVEEAGLSGDISVDSAGTGHWHAGEAAHPGTLEALRRNGIELDHEARTLSKQDMALADYIVAMDMSNYGDLRRLDAHGSLDGKLHLLLDFTPAGLPREVPDPYYAGNFDEVYALVAAGCRGLLATIRAERRL